MANILVVDDDKVILRTVQATLVKANHSVVTAADGYDALETAERELFDLVITDANMPGGLSGFNVANTLKHSPRYKNTPMMLLTGRREKKDVVKALESGLDDYMVKPIDFDMLLAKVEALLQTKPGLHTFRGTTTKVFATWTISLKIEGVSEQGFVLKSPTVVSVNSKLKIDSKLYEEIGITSPLLRIASCTPLPKENGFLVRANFIGLTEMDFQKIRIFVSRHGLIKAA